MREYHFQTAHKTLVILLNHRPYSCAILIAKTFIYMSCLFLTHETFLELIEYNLKSISKRQRWIEFLRLIVEVTVSVAGIEPLI